MVSVILNGNTWQFECLSTSGFVLAQVYDKGKAEALQSMYNAMETQDKDLQQQYQQEQEMAEMGWRVEDNKGGE